MNSMSRKAKYKMTVVTLFLNQKVHRHELDMGLEETSKEHWKENEEYFAENGHKNFRYEFDDKGVKRLFSRDISSVYKFERMDESKFTPKDKIKYYKERMKDHTLSKQQRDFASKRLAQLQK